MNNVQIVRDILAESFIFRPVREIDEIITTVFEGYKVRKKQGAIRDEIVEVLQILPSHKAYSVIPSIVRILQTAYIQEVATTLEKTKLN